MGKGKLEASVDWHICSSLRDSLLDGCWQDHEGILRVNSQIS